MKELHSDNNHWIAESDHATFHTWISNANKTTFLFVKLGLEDNLRIDTNQRSHATAAFNPKCANHNKSRLLFSSAEMFNKPLWQTV